MKSIEAKLEISLGLLNHAEQLISLGEQRAYIIGATNLIMLGVCIENTKNISNIIGADNAPILVILFSIALLFSVFVLAPQSLSIWMPKIVRKSRNSTEMLFFGSISDMTRIDLLKLFQDSEENIMNKILVAAHYRSKKAKTKFTLLTISTALTFIGIFTIAASSIRYFVEIA